LLGKKSTLELGKLVPMQSCVREAILLADTKGVHALHDTTEGGLVAALNEMADASHLGFEIELEKIPIQHEMSILEESFHLSKKQALSASSTGTVIAAVDPRFKEVQETLQQHGVANSILGFFTKSHKRILRQNGKKTFFPKKADDPYTKILLGRL
jgi:hydrogenase maturation factor